MCVETLLNNIQYYRDINRTLHFGSVVPFKLINESISNRLLVTDNDRIHVLYEVGVQRLHGTDIARPFLTFSIAFKQSCRILNYSNYFR